MKIALLPGDARQAFLGELLRADGHTVVPHAPGEAAGAWLFPLPTGAHPALEALPPGSLALVGMAAGSYPLLRLRDYASDEAVLLRNAAITAEGALAAAMAASDRTLAFSRSLILGGGRIAQALAPRLRALGAEVTLWARNEGERARAEGAGCRTLDALPPQPDGYDFVFNTVPAPVLERKPAGVAIELASAPGGFRDPTGVLIARGLPGKTAPRSAAEALVASIRSIIREEST